MSVSDWWRAHCRRIVGWETLNRSLMAPGPMPSAFSNTTTVLRAGLDCYQGARVRRVYNKKTPVAICLDRIPERVVHGAAARSVGAFEAP